MRVRIGAGNRKTGHIPTTSTERASCPSDCKLKGSGCYAENAPLVWQWEKVATDGRTWSEFCAEVRKFARGQLWRHNAAGDLPHKAGKIDRDALAELVRANRGRRGFTFTHHRMTLKSNREAVSLANSGGFTVNLSANTAAEADRLASLGVAPVVCVMPLADWKTAKTPAGRTITRCPAEYQDITCAQCGACQVSLRAGIIGFTVHGNRKNAANIIARG